MSCIPSTIQWYATLKLIACPVVVDNCSGAPNQVLIQPKSNGRLFAPPMFLSEELLGSLSPRHGMPMEVKYGLESTADLRSQYFISALGSGKLCIFTRDVNAVPKLRQALAILSHDDCLDHWPASVVVTQLGRRYGMEIGHR